MVKVIGGGGGGPELIKSSPKHLKASDNGARQVSEGREFHRRWVAPKKASYY